jgi:hypothetical protein
MGLHAAGLTVGELRAKDSRQLNFITAAWLELKAGTHRKDAFEGQSAVSSLALRPKIVNGLHS